MSSSTPTPTDVYDVFDTLRPPGTPFTTTEVADHFECADRTVYNRLNALVEDGRIETKKVGARGRVWWLPIGDHHYQKQAELDAFRVELANAIRSLTDPVEIQHEAARVVGEHLDVDRAHYGEVLADGNTNVVHADYYRGDVPSVVGEHKLSDFGDVLPETFQAGEIMAIDDISTMPELSDEERAAYIDIQIRAWVNAPLMKEGTLTGYFTVTQSTPREWTETEIAMIEETAERTWAAVERARAEEALQANEEKYRLLFEEMDEGFAINELVRDADGQVCDVRYTELNDAVEDLTGVSRTDAEGRLASDVFPGQGDEFFETFERVAETGEHKRVENYVSANDHWYDVLIFPRDEDVVAVLYDDITEYKRLEKQLRTENEHVDLAVANSPLVLFRMDADLRYTWIKNPAGDFDPEAVLGKRDDELLSPASAETVMAPKRTALETGETVREELTYELPSGKVTYDLTVDPVYDESGEITGLTCVAVDITERKGLQKQLRTEKEQLDVAVANSPLVVFRMDTDLRYTWVKNPNKDFDPEAVLGKREDEFLPPETAEILMAPKRTALETGETVREELTYELPSGKVTYDLTVAPLRDDSGKIIGLTCAALDITEQKRLQRSLERLNAATRELIDASPETISDRVAGLAVDILGVEYASLWRYDEADGELREHDSRSDPELDAQAVRLPDDFAEDVWQAFIGDAPEMVDDVDEHEGEKSSLRSRVLAPVGRHGVICAGSTDVDAFTERTIRLIETVAATLATAWDRAESAESLARQNEELSHLERLYSLMWQIDQALVQADTVDAIDEAVCERLAASDLFEFTWIGDFTAETDSVEPRAWAGIDSIALDDFVTVANESVAHESPFASAIRTGTTQVVADIATDPRAVPWRERSLEQGARSCLCIPLVHDEAVYGVLVVYGRSPLNNRRDSSILTELGQTIAHAIHAVETRMTQRTDSVVELTLRTTTAETPLLRLSRETGCVIEFEGLVPEADSDTTVFFTASGISPDELVSVGEQSIPIEELVHLTDRADGSLFKAKLADATLPMRLLEGGATIRSLTFDEGMATAVVALPETADVREFVEEVKREVDDLELLARQSHIQRPDTGQPLQTAFEQRLTPRQQEILQLAYWSGYFESPRVQTGKELSDALDLSQSTFNYHLRGAERTLLAVVFDHA